MYKGEERKKEKEKQDVGHNIDAASHVMPRNEVVNIMLEYSTLQA